MKILHALETFLPVSENWIFPQITRVAGVEPAIICRERANDALFPLDGAPVFQDPPPWRAGLGLPRLVNSLAFRLGHPQFIAGAAARKWRPDLIHAHFGMRGWESLALRRALGVPMITSFYGIDAWQLPTSSALWRARLTELFAEGDGFLAEGPAMRERLIAIGCPAERIEVMRLGVDLAGLPFKARDFRPPLRVVMMARFVEKKGFPDGLRAAAQAVENGADLQLTIVGDATDAAGEEIKRELHEIAQSPALAGRVRFEGFVPPARARELLGEAHVFLCPSKHAAGGDAEGGSPLALTEAMATGLLCIGTRHCDIPEVIIDGETGLLCDSGDIAGLAAALERAAADSPARAEWCERGRRHIEARFSIEESTAALGALYRRAAISG